MFPEVLWITIANHWPWGEDHGTPDLRPGGQRSRRPTTCDQHWSEWKSLNTEPLACAVCNNSQEVVSELDCRTLSWYLESWRTGWCGGKTHTHLVLEVLGVKTVHKEERGVLHSFLYFMQQRTLRGGETLFLVILGQTWVIININVHSTLLLQEIPPHPSELHSPGTPLK